MLECEFLHLKAAQWCTFHKLAELENKYNSLYVLNPYNSVF